MTREEGGGVAAAGTPKAKESLWTSVYHETLLKVARLSGTAARVFSVLLTYLRLGTGEGAFPSYRTIMSRSDLSRQGVADGLNALEAAGVIARKSGKAAGKTNDYQVFGLKLAVGRASEKQTPPSPDSGHPQSDELTPGRQESVVPPSQLSGHRTKTHVTTTPLNEKAGNEGAACPPARGEDGDRVWTWGFLARWNDRAWERTRVSCLEDGETLLLLALRAGLSREAVEARFADRAWWHGRRVVRLGEFLDEMLPGHGFEAQQLRMGRARHPAKKATMKTAAGL